MRPATQLPEPFDVVVNGLAKEVGSNESTVYRFIYRGMIPAESVHHEPQTGIYLIQNDAPLIVRLRQRVERNKHRKGQLKSTVSS